MQTGVNYSSLQVSYFSQTSYTTTKSSENIPQEETKNLKANNVPQIEVNENGSNQTSAILANSALSKEGLSDFQKTILNKTLEKVAEIKNEMLDLWEELFPSAHKKTSSSNSLSIESLLSSNISTNLAQKNLGNGISITQGFSQNLSINIEGTIVGNDGVERKLSLSVGIHQSFVQNLQTSTQSTQAQNAQNSDKKVIDPLVIDYAGSGTELSDTKMQFDLDSDGMPNQISTLKEGSGFLALDKNNDGIINNGNELFGTKSGDGFKDLSIYDSNSDGKIDKEDPIYDKLRIWTPNENGEGQLIGLGEKGIGTIYLNAQESREMMRGKKGDLLGIKQKTADFLYNNGNTGKIHHIDLVSETIKDNALKNQAQNDKLLNSNLLQSLINKTYASNTDINTTEKTSTKEAQNPNLNTLFGENFSFKFSFSLNIQTSFSALQKGENGISSEVSKIWIQLESSFNHLINTSNTKEFTNNESSQLDNLMQSFDALNHLIFDPLHLKERTDVFKEKFFSNDNLHKLLSA